MDITPYVGTIATVVIAFLGFYGAMTSRLTRMETKMDELAKQVEKHNNIVEKVYTHDRDIKTAFNRIDELKERDERLEQKIEKFHG